MADESIQGRLWGAQQYQGNSQPRWFKDLSSGGAGFNANNVTVRRPNHPAAAENLEATDRGWERVVRYTDSAGTPRTKREVVVAHGGLANTLAYGTSGTVTSSGACAGPVIVDIRWGEANTTSASDITYASGAGSGANVVIVFSEPVYLNESGGRATIKISSISTKSGAADGGLTAFCISGNGTNKLVFSNTCTLVADDTLGLTNDVGTTKSERPLFIVLNSATLTGLLANTGYGRGANAVYQHANRIANVSSYGVTSGAATTVQGNWAYAANAGIRTVAS